MEPPETSAWARPSATALAACTIEASGVERTAKAGSAALAIETGCVDDLDPIGHRADLGGGTEEDYARAGLGRLRSTGRDLGGTQIRSARVNGDGDHRAGQAAVGPPSAITSRPR